MSLIHGVHRPHAAGPALVARPRSDAPAPTGAPDRRGPRVRATAAAATLTVTSRAIAATGVLNGWMNAADRAQPRLGTVEHTRWAGRRGRRSPAHVLRIPVFTRRYE